MLSKSLIITIICLGLLFSACGIRSKIEPPKHLTALSPETENLLKVNRIIDWQDADPEIRCHFIYSESCANIEKKKGIKIYSHINRCAVNNDFELTDHKGHLYVIKNVSVSQAKDIKTPSSIQLAEGLRYQGTFLVIAESHEVYDVAEKKLLYAKKNTGLPANTFSVWYQEDPITDEGRWICDLDKDRKHSEKFKFMDCKTGEDLVRFVHNKTG